MNRSNSNYRNKPTPVQFMSTRERENLHRLGVWVDKWGNHVPVHDMFRLAAIVDYEFENH